MDVDFCKINILTAVFIMVVNAIAWLLTILLTIYPIRVIEKCPLANMKRYTRKQFLSILTVKTGK